jgi:glyoxylase-like metal-dependent hydrolase (beta-lactamase superfamily II)
VRPLDSRTLVLREGLCATWEAPFMYLLVGSRKALLLDTGDLADPAAAPLARTVEGLLPGGTAGTPLLVVHTHSHLDHRAGDPQFEGRTGVQVVPADLAHVRDYFGFQGWPEGSAVIDLGDRVVDVWPAPGHHRAQVVYYDRTTALLFTGDLLLPGRLLVDDLAAYQRSARRLAELVKDRPVAAVLGGHVEKNRVGALYDFRSTFHPEEASIALTKADVLALPAALDRFGGFTTETGGFVIMNPIHNLVAAATGAVIVLVGLALFAYRLVRRRRLRRSRT